MSAFDPKQTYGEPLFNYLVGTPQEQQRHFKPERLGGLKIDHQLELVGRLDGKLAWLHALEDAIYVRRRARITSCYVDSIGN
jgi:hypothetical protein